MLNTIISVSLFVGLTCDNGLACCDAESLDCYAVTQPAECRPGRKLGWCQGDDCQLLEPYVESGRRCCPVYDNELLADVCTMPLGQTDWFGLIVVACPANMLATRCPSWVDKGGGYYGCIGQW